MTDLVKLLKSKNNPDILQALKSVKIGGENNRDDQRFLLDLILIKSKEIINILTKVESKEMTMPEGLKEDIQNIYLIGRHECFSEIKQNYPKNFIFNDLYDFLQNFIEKSSKEYNYLKEYEKETVITNKQKEVNLIQNGKKLFSITIPKKIDLLKYLGIDSNNKIYPYHQIALMLFYFENKEDFSLLENSFINSLVYHKIKNTP